MAQEGKYVVYGKADLPPVEFSHTDYSQIPLPYLVEGRPKISRKRFIKLAMGHGFSRNEANAMADWWREQPAPYRVHPGIWGWTRFRCRFIKIG